MNLSQLSLRRIRAMIIKEWLQILRDPSTLLIAFILPIMLVFLFGYAVNLDTARTRIGIAMQDGGEAARSLATDFQRSAYFNVVASGTVTTLGDDLVGGKIRAIVVIPADFGKAMLQGRGSVQVITDGTVPNTAVFASAYANGLVSSWKAGRAAERGGHMRPPITVENRFWYNPELKSRYFLVPGSISIILAMIGSLLTGLVVAREWERGTMEAIMATPLRMSELILIKVIPYFVLGLISMTICTLLAVYAFGVPFRGSALSLLVIASCFLFPSLGLGLLISATSKSQFVASQIGLLSAFLPAIMLSGFLFEINSMPQWVQAVSIIVPARYFVPSLQTIFIAGDNWHLFLPNCAILVGFGLLFFTLTVRATKRRIA